MTGTIQREALEAISEFVVAGALEKFCTEHGMKFHPEEPPYVTMARIADFALRIPVDHA